MSARHFPFAARRFAALASLLLVAASPLSADEYFAGYGLSPNSVSIDLGVQPLGYPSGVISAVMRRDRILGKALADSKQPLVTHPFRAGADMLPLLADHRLEAGLLGDMPTIRAIVTGGALIVGLVKQTSTAIVAKGDTQIQDLAGKRIGYAEASSAHHTLLQGLASVGFSESQVTLVPLRVDEMPEALERGDIDAFAAWEPAPSIALATSDRNRVVFRGSSSDYFVIGRDFVRRSPAAARHLIAGFLRAIEWMRRSQSNVETAGRWVKADGEAFTGKASTLPVAQIVAITRREILNIPSAPAIPISPGRPPLKNEFDFLARLGKLPAGAQWRNVEAAFTYDVLVQVMADRRGFKIGTFDYDDEAVRAK